MNELVRRVQWALMRSEPRAKRLAMVEQLHRPWIDRLRAERDWPVEAMVEMLLLTEGDEEEIDRQLASWNRQKELPLPQARGYQHFLSILHAQHQQRLSKRLQDEQRAERSQRNREDIDSIAARSGRLSAEGRVVAKPGLTQVETVQERMLASTHADRLASLCRKTGLSAALVIEAYQAVARYREPSEQLLLLWGRWNGRPANFPAFAREMARKDFPPEEPS